MGLTGIRCLFCALALLFLAGLPARAETVLLDFENDADLRVWHYERQTVGTPVKELARSERFATSGSSSLRFTSPAWKPGMGEWPAFEGTPPVTDWRGFDRLVFEVTNVTGADQKLFLFISDSKIATRSGYQAPTILAPFSFTRVVVPLAKLSAKRINLADIHVLHFFTERPPVDLEVYLDRMMLVRAGDALPAVAPSFVKEFAPMQGRRVEAMRRELSEAGERVRQATAGAPEVSAWANTLLRKREAEVNAFADRIARADAGLLEEPVAGGRLTEQIASLEAMVKLRASFARVRPAVQARGKGRDDLVVGFASSMEKVLPRALSTPLTVSDRVEVSLARNEKESFQVIVLPCERDVKSVRVRVSDLRDPKGARFSARNVEAVVVGYVETKHTPPYGSSHVGWWPDPILNFQKTADIAKGDAQAFWIRVRAPKAQPAGLYRGKLEVEVDGARAFSFDLGVRVFPFTLPDATPLPLAVTFSPAYYESDGKGGWKEGPYREVSWKKHRLEWGDLLADYYLTYDSLYGTGAWSPDFEILQRLHKQGRLGRFNLGYYGVCGETPEAIAAWRKSTIERMRPYYEQAKKLGILDHAYIYGCDENPKEMFPGVQRAAAILKAEFPGVMVMTTTYDHSFGTDSVIQAMDAFCPLTPSFNLKLAAQARAAGKQVWWYICCGPLHPHANMFVEYPAIEGRLLMGAMTAKYRPDGFLYYQISIWNGKPITRGPFTEWDPRSWTTYDGDGSWLCVGPDGTPLPTIRLENFRDGLEDYAYARILEGTIAKVEASPELKLSRAEWLQKAKAALTVPEDVAKSLTEYTHDPAAVGRWRNAMAEAIATAGVEPAKL